MPFCKHLIKMPCSRNSVFATFLCVSMASFFFAKLCLADRVELKINLGGDSVDGFVAEQEVLDLGDSMAKMRYHGAIKGNGDDLNVFKTQRFTRGEDLVLNFPVADGVYTVTMLFAETWKGAFSSGKRVFDVYMGSKPTGIVKVCSEMDPFRSGGPASPVRRKFQGVATQGGLTVALRPIVQNPQIAGIIIDGYSYSNSLLEDLPTVPGTPGEQPDFSPLERITAQTPADPSLIYDPALNPKFKTEFKQSSGLFPSASTSAPTPAQQVAPTPASSSAFQLGNTQMQSNQANMPPPAPNTNAFGHPGGRSMGHPFGRGQEAQVPPATSAATSPMVPHTQLAPANPPSQPFSPLTALSVRPTSYYRRRLASYPPMEGYDAENDMSSRMESPNSRGPQEHIEAHSAGGNFKPNAEGYTSRGFEGPVQAPPTAYSNSMNYHVPGHQSTALPQGSGPSHGSPATNGYRAGIPTSPGEMRMTSAGASRDGSLEQSQYVHPMSRLSTQDGSSQHNHRVQARTEAMGWEQGGGGYSSHEGAGGSLANPLPQAAETAGTSSSWSSKGGSSLEAPAQVGTGALPDGVDGRPLDALQQYKDDNSASTRAHAGQDEKSSMVPPGVPSDAANSVPAGAYMSRSLSEQPDYTTQMDQKAWAGNTPRAEGSASTVPYMGAERGTGLGNPGVAGWNAKQAPQAGEYPTSVKDSLREDAMSGNVGRALSTNQAAGEDPSGRGQDRTNLGWGASLSGSGPTGDSGSGQDGPGKGMREHQGGEQALPNTVHRTVMEDPAYSRAGGRFPVNQEYQGNMDRMGSGVGNGLRNGFAAEMGAGGESSMGSGMGSKVEENMARIQAMQAAGGGPPGASGLPQKDGLPDLAGMVEGEAEGGSEVGRMPTPGVHNGMNRLDGMCIDNSTHCSCGMAQRTGPVPEECLFVVNERTDPMLCARRACSGRMVCACAAGANMLCKRSNVRSILVAAQVHRHDMVEEPSVVFCRREQIEQGVGVLTPVM